MIEWLWVFYSSDAGRTVGDALRLLSRPPAQVSVRARLEQKMMRYCKTRKVDAMMYQQINIIIIVYILLLVLCHVFSFLKSDRNNYSLSE